MVGTETHQISPDFLADLWPFWMLKSTLGVQTPGEVRYELHVGVHKLPISSAKSFKVNHQSGSSASLCLSFSLRWRFFLNNTCPTQTRSESSSTSSAWCMTSKSTSGSGLNIHHGNINCRDSTGIENIQHLKNVVNSDASSQEKRKCSPLLLRQKDCMAEILETLDFGSQESDLPKQENPRRLILDLSGC